MNTHHRQDHGITEDDPLLTAYALGELEGEDLARLEDALARDSSLRVSIDRIRVTCGAISEALAREPEAALPLHAKASGRKASPQSARLPSAASRRRSRGGALLDYPGLYFVVAGLSAACFALLAVLQSPSSEGPGLSGAPRSARVIVPLPPLEELPGDMAGNAGRAVVEELADSSASGTSVSLPTDTAKPAPLVAELQQPAGNATAAGAPANPSTLNSSASFTTVPPFEPKLSLPSLQAATAQIAKAPLFEGFGAGSSLRPFEGANPSEDRVFVPTAAKPESVLGVRVESASYAQVRKALREGRHPDKSSVQIEQLVNAFSFAADQSAARDVHVGPARHASAPRPLDPQAALVSTQIEYAPAPWNPDHLLVRVALQARPQPVLERPAERLLVLAEDSLPADARRLLSEALRGMVGRLRRNDHVVLGRLGGGLELVCSAEAGAGRWDLQAAIGDLCNGERSTPGFISEELLREASQATRIIVCSAGQPRLPEAVLNSPAPLSVLTLGEASLSAQSFAELSRRGSFRSDRARTLGQARELLLEEAGNPDPVIARGTLLTTEFNPRLVASYRVLGYDGDVQAYAAAEPADMLAGQSFTVLYELIPTSAAKALASAAARSAGVSSDPVEREQLLKVALRYEDTQRRALRRHQFVVLHGAPAWERASDDFRFAAAVAAMGMIMRDSPHRGSASLEQVGRWASGRGVSVPAAEREEFSLLLERAKRVL